MSTTPPIAMVEQPIATAGLRRGRGNRTTKIRGYRAGFWVYAGLAVVIISAVFPLLLVVPDRLGRRLDDQRPRHVVDPRRQLPRQRRSRSSTTRR